MTQAEMDVQKLEDRMAVVRKKGKRLAWWLTGISVILCINSLIHEMPRPYGFFVLPACAWFALYAELGSISRKIGAIECGICMTEYYGSRADEEDRS